MSKQLLFAVLFLLAASSLPGSPLLAAPAAAPPETLTEALRLVRQARTEAGDQQERTVASAREVLQRDAELASGSGWLTDALQAGRYNLARAEAQLSSALAIAAQKPSEDRDTAASLHDLRSLLRAPPFATVHWVDALPEWLRPLGALVEVVRLKLLEAVSWLAAQLSRLFYDFVQTPFALIGAALVVSALVLLYKYALRSAIVREVGAEDAPSVAGLTHHAALARAQELFQGGQYREASHYLLASVFLWCDANGWVRFDPSMTNREHLTQLRNHPALAARLTPLVNRFDRAWYGQATVSGSDYQDMAALAATVREVAA